MTVDSIITKGSGGFRYISLLDVVWKVMSSIIDSMSKAKIEVYDSLHGFTAKRGVAMATIEAKLQMQAAHVQRKTLFQIFIDLS
jgi:hypothetical protein